MTLTERQKSEFHLGAGYSTFQGSMLLERTGSFSDVLRLKCLLISWAGVYAVGHLLLEKGQGGRSDSGVIGIEVIVVVQEGGLMMRKPRK